MAPIASEAIPEGTGWSHEIKHDGYRTLIVLSSGEARLFTRNGHDWTSRYHPIAAAARALDTSGTLLDGEMIVQDDMGRSDFAALPAAIRDMPGRLIFMAFDILDLAGRDLRREPLSDRRQRLRDLIGGHDPNSCLQFSESVADGPALFAAANAMELEGIVSKRTRSCYRSGPSRDWLKIKCWTEGDFLLIGTMRGEDVPTAVLGRETEKGIEYAGTAMVTLAGDERGAFWEAAALLTRPEPAIALPRPIVAQWVEPRLRVRVRYLRGSDKLRHATIKGLRSVI